MPAWLHTARLEVAPGAGLVGRWPGVVIVLADDAGDHDNADDNVDGDLPATLDALIGDQGWPLPEVLRDRIEALATPVRIAVVLEQSAAEMVWVYSSGVPCFDAQGHQLSSGGATIEPGQSLTIGLTSADSDSPGHSAPCHPALTLTEGLVPGCGAILRAPSAAVADAPTTVPSAVFDDGASYLLDTNYVIGREPADQNKTGFGPIVLGDDENSVSRSHAQLEVRDGAIVLTDLGSTNGTHLLEATTNQWSRLVPNVPTTLKVGARVAIGSRQFVIEATP